ncbi:MAG TPA: hypothetical protein DCF68_01890 [Cyanothece sp. UBA12306]|nr:hypothetical protein [Cyanothece sp. UBA12306]
MSFVQKFLFSHTHYSLLPLSILISLGIINNCPVQAVEKNFNLNQLIASEEISLSQNIAKIGDGVYLYGRSPKPEVFGQEYLVFKVQQGKVVGAFYMPRSEFSCFSGSLNPRQMNVSITDPYDGTKHDYAIALEAVSPLAANSSNSQEIGLEGYHRLNTISENDQRILNTCLSEN